MRGDAGSSFGEVSMTIITYPAPALVSQTFPRSRSSLLEERHQQQSHDFEHLDHRVDGGTGGVFVGIADRVAGDGCLVRRAALASVMAILDVFLGVIPRAAA